MLRACLTLRPPRDLSSRGVVANAARNYEIVITRKASARRGICCSPAEAGSVPYAPSLNTNCPAAENTYARIIIVLSNDVSPDAANIIAITTN